MIHVILKPALHFRLYSCLVADSYIIMLYCLIYSYNFFMLVCGIIIIAVVILPHFQVPALYIHNYDTMIIQVYY